MIEAHTVFCRAADARFRKVDDEGRVYCRSRSEIVGLNEVGTRILELCDGATSFDTVIDRLEEEFDVDRETLAEDTAGFVTEMVELGILVEVV